ncbi:hypothetical protein KAW18_02205 [candidate division WOR-3 bacterium]|nr:hypothetical protein [candidate division WOR-3 bacterium]
MKKKETCEICEISHRLYREIHEILRKEIDEEVFFMDDAIAVLDRVKTDIIQHQVKSQIMTLMEETRDEMQAEQVDEKKKVVEGMEVG